MTRKRFATLQRRYAALGFTLSRRQDAFAAGIIEAQCAHGVGHPIPESIAEVRKHELPRNRRWIGVHGCDGCCAAFTARRRKRPKRAKSR